MSLLPNNTTPLERAVEAVSQLVEAPSLVTKLWDAQQCPAPFLPWLAWAMSVDDWDPTWSEQRKRQAIAESIEIHELKGTPSAVKRILAIRGHGDADVIERAGYIKRDGSHTRDGTKFRGGQASWATFKVILKKPITIDQVAALSEAIDKAKRNCCHLVQLDYRQALIRRNGVVLRNGSYTRGVVNN